MKKNILGFVLLCVASFCYAQTSSMPGVGELLPPSVAYKPGALLLKVDKGYGIETALLPRFQAAAEFPENFTTKDAAKALRIEAIVVLPGSKDYVGHQDLSLILQKLALILNSAHSLEGIEYWSASRQKMRTLYAESYRIKAPDNRSRLADPANLAELGHASSWTYYTYQRTLTFGGSVMKFDIKDGGTYLSMMNENVTSMNLLLVPVVSPGNIKSGIIVIPCKEGLLVYSISTIRALDIAASRVFESAENKSLAVLSWFVRQAVNEGLVENVTLPVKAEEIK